MTTPASQELVPTSYHLAAWNTIHDTNLESHNQQLSREDARRINAHFIIKLVGGVHGTEDQPPSQQDYDDVDAVIDSMDTNDILFVEGVGFYRSSVEPPEKLTREYVADWRQRAEDVKASNGNAWWYGRYRAIAKGIPVVNADFNGYEAAAAKGIGVDRDDTSNGAALQTVGEDGKTLMQRLVIEGRNKSASSIVKDRALRELPPEQSTGTTPAMTRKRRLFMLDGARHIEGMEEQFDGMRLHYTSEITNTTDPDLYNRRVRPRLAAAENESAPLDNEQPAETPQADQHDGLETSGTTGSPDFKRLVGSSAVRSGTSG